MPKRICEVRGNPDAFFPQGELGEAGMPGINGKPGQKVNAWLNVPSEFEPRSSQLFFFL